MKKLPTFRWHDSYIRATFATMDGIYLEIPGMVLESTGTPRPQLEIELLRRLVGEMYTDGLIGGSSACMLAGREKSELHHWLCDSDCVRPLGYRDYELERRNLDEWLTGI